MSAQSHRQAQLRVEYQTGDPMPRDYSVELVEMNRHIVVATAQAGSGGEFTFGSLQRGQYLARVTDGAGRVVREETIWFDGANPVMRINAPMKPAHERPTGQTVSMRQLQNPPAKEAMKSFMLAQKFSQSGQHEKAAAALEKAISISPDFAMAHTNLGAQYLRLGQFEKGLEESLRAMEIGGPNVHDLVNSALAQWTLGRPADALRLAEQALGLDRGCMPAHFIAGSMMAMNPATFDEGIKHLEIAAEKIPAAAQNLAKARELVAGMHNE